MRETTIQKILDTRLIAIVRGVYGDDCIRLAEALYAGGIELIEVTFDQANPELQKKTSECIRMINEKFAGRVLAGAGTVTSSELVQEAYDAGAKYIISPNTNLDVICKTRDLNMVSIPGALTPSEVLSAYDAGADFVKLFPVSTLGPAYVKAVRAPLNHVRLLAVGGVNDKNMGDYLAAGAVGAGVGGNLVNREWVANCRFDEITELAKKYCLAAGR